MNGEQKNKNNFQQNKHLVVVHGTNLQYSGPNHFILNNAIVWKNMGYKITIICQDREAKSLSIVDSYYQGSLPHDARILEEGQLRIVVPDINNLIPIHAPHKKVQYPGIGCKPIIEMTDQQIQINISMTIKCLKDVINHDRPYKVISNYPILSAIICSRGLKDTGIKYDVTFPGPALKYTIMPYPQLWKWIIPSFSDTSKFYLRTQLVKQLFLKTFKQYKQQYNLAQKSIVIGPSMDCSAYKISVDKKKTQHQFLQYAQKSNSTSQKVAEKQKVSHYSSIIDSYELQSHPHKKSQNSIISSDLISSWIPWKEQDQTILFVGAFIKKIGAGQLLVIAPKLILQRPTIKFIFAGTGPLRNLMLDLLDAFQAGDLEQALQIGRKDDFITEVDIKKYFVKIDKKIRQRIVFTGLLNQQTITKLMPLCDVFVSPTRLPQQFSPTIIQALCFGVTPVCNDHSWFSYVMDVLSEEYPQLTQVVRIEKDEFFEKLPQTITKTFDFINKNIKQQVQLQYRQKLNEIAQKRFSWENSAKIMAQPH